VAIFRSTVLGDGENSAQGAESAVAVDDETISLEDGSNIASYEINSEYLVGLQQASAPSSRYALAVWSLRTGHKLATLDQDIKLKNAPSDYSI
jgi:hypothetical protein